MDYDDLLKQIGECGRYQIFILIIVFAISLPAAFNTVGIVFLAGTPEHWCATPALDHLNLTKDVIRHLSIPLEKNTDGVSVYSSCAMYDRNYSGWTENDVWRSISSNDNYSMLIPCRDEWVYDDSLYSSTIVSQWGMVCDRRWLKATAASVYMAGIMAGSLFSGIASDAFGRRLMGIVCFFFKAILTFVVAFSPNFVAFATMRFAIAALSIAFYVAVYVLALEFVGPMYRPVAGMITKYSWAVGYVLFAGLAYGIRDWFTLQLVGACPYALLLIAVFFLPESPRWLLSNNKHDKAEIIIRKVAHWNKAELPQKIEIAIKVDKKSNIRDLCRPRIMALRTLNVCFQWIVITLVYYGLSLNTSNIGGNVYVNFAIAGAVEIPAYYISQLAVGFIGRRWTLCSTLVVGGAAMLATIGIPPSLNWVTITLAMIGKFCVTGSFGTIYLFTAELYPTGIRNTSVSMGSVAARLGAIAAPYIAQLADVSRLIPLILFGGLSILAGLLTLTFPETRGQKLAETVENGAFSRRNHILKEDEVNENDVNGRTNRAFDVTKL